MCNNDTLIINLIPYVLLPHHRFQNETFQLTVLNKYPKNINRSVWTKHDPEFRPKKIHDCKECSLVFENWFARIYHMKRYHSKETFQCSTCQHQFYTPKLLKQHGLVHQGVGEFPCKVRNKVLKRRKSLADHMRTRIRERPFMCPYRSSSSSLLAHHKRSKLKMLLEIFCDNDTLIMYFFHNVLPWVSINSKKKN